jgi:hypothetical protein
VRESKTRVGRFYERRQEHLLAVAENQPALVLLVDRETGTAIDLITLLERARQAEERCASHNHLEATA